MHAFRSFCLSFSRDHDYLTGPKIMVCETIKALEFSVSSSLEGETQRPAWLSSSTERCTLLFLLNLLVAGVARRLRANKALIETRWDS